MDIGGGSGDDDDLFVGVSLRLHLHLFYCLLSVVVLLLCCCWSEIASNIVVVTIAYVEHLRYDCMILKLRDRDWRKFRWNSTRCVFTFR